MITSLLISLTPGGGPSGGPSMAAADTGGPPAKRWRKNMSWTERGRKETRRDRSKRDDKRRHDAANRKAIKEQVLHRDRLHGTPDTGHISTVALSLRTGD